MINQKHNWAQNENHMLEGTIKEIVASIKKGEIDTHKLSELNRLIANGVQAGDVNPSVKADALTENILLAFETREIGGVHSFLMTNLDDHVFVLGTSEKGFSKKYIGDESTIIGNKILVNIAKRLHKLSVKYGKYTAVNVLDNWTRLIISSLAFVDGADSAATQLAKTPIAKSLEMDAAAIFKDAIKVEPQTDLGKVTRKEAQKELLEKYVA
jgi:hypothetical protein